MSTPEFTSLFVGDLDHKVTEKQLYDLFNKVGQVVSLRICRDLLKRACYGYINFASHHEATQALKSLNFFALNGKPIRIMFSNKNPDTKFSPLANVFIKNLELSIDSKTLNDVFSNFGTIISCKVIVDREGKSKGYGFIQFASEESAKNAIKKLNGMLINDKQVYVGLFVRHEDRKFTNVYVKNLSEIVTDDDLAKVFGVYGTITSAIVMKSEDGRSRGFGFVNFQNPDDAVTAINKLNGFSLTGHDKKWYVGRAQKEAELKAKYEKLKAANLYVKNLDDTIDNDEKLKKLFSEFGTINSCKIMLDDEKRLSKGYGFVGFSKPIEALKALKSMNGKIIGRKPLYVAVAQSKEERRAILKAYFDRAHISTGSFALSPAVFQHPNSVPYIRLMSVPYNQQVSSGLMQPAAIVSRGPVGLMMPLTWSNGISRGPMMPSPWPYGVSRH